MANAVGSIPPTTVNTGQPDPVVQPKLLIGEGQEEVLFFRALLDELNIQDVQVEQYGGKQRLRAYLEALLKRPDFRRLVSLGITRDADNHAAGAFQGVCDALRANNLHCPNAVNQPVSGPIRLVVYIFPGRGKKGMLEDLCLAAVAQDKGMECVKDFFRCLTRSAKRRPKNLSKARMRVWLASQPEPDLLLGQAARKQYWSWDHTAFAGIKKFLRSL